MNTRHALLALLAAGFFAATGWAQEQAFANRATEMRAQPAGDSPVVAPLAENASVKVISRQGAWTQVEGGGKRGWVRAFHLRFPSTVETTSSGAAMGGLSSLGAALGLGPSKGPETSKVATLGIRGLTPEDFKNASPDAAALRKLQSFRADKPSAERFAKEAKLAPVTVAYADGGGRP